MEHLVDHKRHCRWFLALPVATLLLDVVLLTWWFFIDPEFVGSTDLPSEYHHPSKLKISGFATKPNCSCSTCGGLWDGHSSYSVRTTNHGIALRTFSVLSVVLIQVYQIGSSPQEATHEAGFAHERRVLVQIVEAFAFLNAVLPENFGGDHLTDALFSAVFIFMLVHCLLFINSPIPSAIVKQRAFSVTQAAALIGIPLELLSDSDRIGLVYVGNIGIGLVLGGLMTVVLVLNGLPRVPHYTEIRAAARDLLRIRNHESTAEYEDCSAGFISIMATLWYLVFLLFTGLLLSALDISDACCPELLWCSQSWCDLLFRILVPPLLLIDGALHKLYWEAGVVAECHSLFGTLPWQQYQLRPTDWAEQEYRCPTQVAQLSMS